MSASNAKSKSIKSRRTKPKPTKKKFLKKFVVMEGSGSPRDQSKVLSDVLSKLWKFQKECVSFTLKRKATFLAMETGTGKTLTTLASLQQRHVIGSVDEVCIICLASGVHVWETEITKWLGGTTLRFFIVSYEFARFYFKYLRKEPVQALVLDEIHKLRNHASAQSRRIAIVARYIPFRYGLTGTEIGDNVIDLYGEWLSLNPLLLGDKWKTFKRRYLESCGFGGYDVRLRRGKREEILRLVAPHTFQALKKDVLPHLKVLPPVYMYAKLKGTQEKLYRKIEKELIARSHGHTVSAPRAITQMIRLQQITGGHVPSDDDDMLTFECGKADILNDLLKDWNRKKKLVIYARFRYELKLIQALCKKHKLTSYIYSRKEPHMDIVFFKEQHPQVSISSIQSGISRNGLQKASTAIFFSRNWSYVDYRQALDRLYRSGQEEPVTPILLETENTIDEDIDGSINRKQEEGQFVKMFLKRLRNKKSIPSKT